MKFKGLVLGCCMLAPAFAAADCTHGGKYEWYTCYGIEHTIIEAVAIKFIDHIEEPLGLPAKSSNVAGWVGCGGFIYRETQGPGNLFSNADRALDWIAPCAVALFYDPGENDENQKHQLRLTNFIDNRPVSLGVTWETTWE